MGLKKKLTFHLKKTDTYESLFFLKSFDFNNFKTSLSVDLKCNCAITTRHRIKMQ